VEYVDRAGTLAAVTVAGAALITRTWPRLRSRERAVMVAGIVWSALGLALTVFLPVRSSLYACFPAVGLALGAGAALQALDRSGGLTGSRWAALAALVACVIWVPVARSRNVRWVRPAELSARVLDDFRVLRPELQGEQAIVLHDAVGTRASLQGAFGTLVGQAVQVATGLEGAAVWIEPPPPGIEAAGLRPPQGTALHYWLRDGQLVDGSGQGVRAAHEFMK
jgi:hypothetical protein